MTDAETFEYYDDPANREPAQGPARRRPQRALTHHVPVRFPAETIEQVTRIADDEGMTVSAWIRRAVERAVRLAGEAEQPRGEDETRLMVERLQRDVADLAAAPGRAESR
jgi:hypothetical protein